MTIDEYNSLPAWKRLWLLKRYRRYYKDKMTYKQFLAKHDFKVFLNW